MGWANNDNSLLSTKRWRTCVGGVGGITLVLRPRVSAELIEGRAVRSTRGFPGDGMAVEWPNEGTE